MIALIGPAFDEIEPQAFAEQRDDAEEGEKRAGELARGNPIARDVDVRECDRHQRERREENGRETAVEELLTPVDQSVVGCEEHDADPDHQQPLGSSARPSCVDQRKHDREHGASQEETQCRDGEGPEPAVADLDDQPGRSPDDTEKNVERDPRHRDIVAVQCGWPARGGNMLRAFAIALASCLVLAAAAWAQTQTQTQTAPSSSASRSPVELVGCVSKDPGTSGSFTFNESTGSKYRLSGKSVRQYAGRMVRLVGGPRGKRLAIRGGLWPSPNVAGQAGAMDPAQESIARQPGGAAAGAGRFDLPEFRVVSVQGIDGSCE